MRVIKSYDQNNVTCYFKVNDDCSDEFKAFLEHGCELDKITYQILEMTEEEFNNLPEFEGW